jgi:hypothetical protein
MYIRKTRKVHEPDAQEEGDIFCFTKGEVNKEERRV